MPDFDSEVLEYRVDVEEPDTRALCYGEPVIVDGASIALRAPTGNRLEEGDNSFFLDVTALDGETQQTYHLIVYRPPAPERDPRLTRLEVYLGNQLLPLTPAFNRHVFEYTATLPVGAAQGGWETWWWKGRKASRFPTWGRGFNLPSTMPSWELARVGSFCGYLPPMRALPRTTQLPWFKPSRMRLRMTDSKPSRS